MAGIVVARGATAALKSFEDILEQLGGPGDDAAEALRADVYTSSGITEFDGDPRRSKAMSDGEANKSEKSTWLGEPLMGGGSPRRRVLAESCRKLLLPRSPPHLKKQPKSS